MYKFNQNSPVTNRDLKKFRMLPLPSAKIRFKSNQNLFDYVI